jgi:hypothetical protein
MADTVADLSGEEREKRIAELKAKMQSAAKKAKPELTSEPKQPAAAAQPAAQPAAERAAVQKTAGQASAAYGNGAASNGAASNGAASNGAASNGVTAGLAQPAAATVPAFVEESPEEKAHKEMSRREFLTYGWGGVLGLVTLPVWCRALSIYDAALQGR